MTIRKGQEWGKPGPLPDDGVVAADDAAARRIVERARGLGVDPPVIGLLGGDLWRTLGAPKGGEVRLRSAEAATFVVDLGIAHVDGEEHCFVAHVVASRWPRTRTWLALNAQWLGDLNVGPRAHPNDGLLDLYDWRLAITDVAKVRGRARQGAHLPHPGITHVRVREETIDFGTRLNVWVDGDRVARARDVSVRLEPDALTVVV